MTRQRPAPVLVAVVALVVACGGSSSTAIPSTQPMANPTAPSPLASASSSAAPGSASPSSAATDLGGSWAAGVALPTRRAENAAVAIDGVIYLPGGLDPAGDTVTTFEAFDTA